MRIDLVSPNLNVSSRCRTFHKKNFETACSCTRTLYGAMVTPQSWYGSCRSRKLFLMMNAFVFLTWKFKRCEALVFRVRHCCEDHLFRKAGLSAVRSKRNNKNAIFGYSLCLKIKSKLTLLPRQTRPKILAWQPRLSGALRTLHLFQPRESDV